MKARLVIQTGTERPDDEEIAAGGDRLAQPPADADDEGEIQGENDVIYGSEFHVLGLLCRSPNEFRI